VDARTRGRHRTARDSPNRARRGAHRGVIFVWVAWALGGLATLATVTLVSGVWRIARGRELPAWLREGRRIGGNSTA
jgi:hypothetical protein